MSKQTDKQVIAKLRRKGGKTVNELGISKYRMEKLAEQGLVRRAGFRQTGKRGRPAIEWEVAA